MAGTRVYIEQGERWVFAVCLDWPGWCRRARSADAALVALGSYRERYERIVESDLGPTTFDVLDTLTGNTTTDFGAPSRIWPGDEAGLDDAAIARHLGLLGRNWAYLDAVARRSPSTLMKGPRGGGRDRDAVLDHVREAERTYCANVGRRVAPRTVWSEQRAAVLDALRRGSSGPWPAPYAIRRIAWHVTDHAWEIEDRSPQSTH